MSQPNPMKPQEKSASERELQRQVISAQAQLPVEEIAGKRYTRDVRGALLPVETLKTRDLLQDETVRFMTGFARALSAQMERFKRHSFADVAALQAVLEQEYGAKAGGPKGNVQLQTIDGLLKVQLQNADQIDFGPELQVAKRLIDECLIEWGAASHAAIRAIVTNAFSVEKAGQINRAELLGLLRLEIEDERWNRAMEAVRDSIRVTGTTSYIRFYERDRPDGPWRVIPLDLAKL